MKLFKFASLAASLILAFGIIGISLYQEHCQIRQTSTQKLSANFHVQAKEKESTSSSTASPSATILAGEVNYYLPYPGILPDHPLYWLKMLRDRIKLFLTNEPQGRYELLLIYSDKRIGAAEVLVKGRKFSLGGTTATKAEKYLQQAAEQYQKLAQNEQATAITKDQIKKAMAKHQQILEALIEQTEEDKSALQQALQINTELQRQVNNF